LSRVWRGLTRNRAETDPTSVDQRLLGRTYAIAFDRVWRAALALAGGEMRGWHVEHSDDHTGIIRAVHVSRLFGSVDDVEINVYLDENAQTRVGMKSRSRKGGGDFGRNARSIGRFVRALDRALEATPSQILDPMALPNWSHPS